MRKKLIFLVIFITGVFADNLQNLAHDSQNQSQNLCKNGDITGFWLSPRDKVSGRYSIVEIFKKDGKYFAYQVAFMDSQASKKDTLNQNFALRDREVLGSVHIYNLEREGQNSYINGRYYDFNKGKSFHLKARLECDKLILLVSADNVGFLGTKKIYRAILPQEAHFFVKSKPKIDFSGVVN
ncbi:DUF2147 domain-containing protein [Helicobacter sp. 23-1044]